MNTKAKIQAQLSAYLDGELDEAQLRQVEEALENDGDLRAELADLAVARKLLRDLPAEKPPLDLVSRVLAEAERSQLVGGQTTETSPDALRWIRYAASAAVLLVAATVGMVIAITLCSPDMYKDNLSRHATPARVTQDDKTNLAVAAGKRTDRGEELDRDELGKLAIRGLPTDGTPDGRELKERGGGDLAGRAGIDGKLGTPDDNRRSRTPGPGGPDVPGKTYDGDTTISAGTLTKGGAGNLTKGGAGNLTTGDTVARGGTGDAPGVIASKEGTSALGIATKGGAGSRDDNRNEALKGALGKGLGDNADAVSGPFDNVKSMSRVLAGDTTNNTIIYTDRLDQTQQQVEKVLGANGIAQVVTQQSEASAAVNKTGGEANQARGNFYVANTLSPAQVQYEAYVTPEQLAKVQKDLDSLRARQNVSQDVPALAYNGESARDGGWNYKKDQAGKDGYIAGKASEKPSGIAIAKTDGDKTFGRKIAVPADMPVAPATPLVAPAAKTAATPAPTAPVAETAPPAPVVVAPGRRSGEEAGHKAIYGVQSPDKGKVQLAEAPAKDEGRQSQVQAKPEAQQAKAPESGSGSAGAYRGQSANEQLGDAITHREVAQTSQAPATIRPDEQGKPVVQVGVVKETPPTQSGGTVAVQIASQPGQAGQLFENSATARVQRLVITLNYRQAGENDRTLDRAKFSAAAASQAAPSQSAPANKAAQEAKQEANPAAQSK